MTIETLTPFEIKFQPLDNLITLIFENKIKADIISLYENYKGDLGKTTSSKTDIKSLITDASKECLQLLSKKYRTELIDIYSNDGLAYYTYVNINKLSVNFLEELISR